MVLYEAFLLGEGFGAKSLEGIEAEVIAEVDQAADEALESRKGRMPEGEGATDGVYAG